MYGWNQFPEKQLNKYTLSTALGLTHLNVKELQAYLNDDEKFESAVKDLKQLKDIEAEKDMVMASNLSLAELNLAKDPNYKKRKEEIQLLVEEGKRLLNNIEAKSKELEYRQNESLETSLALLKTATAEVEEESEKLAKKFVDGAMDVEVFLKEFSSYRKMMHLRRVKADKMTEMLTPKTTFSLMSSTADRVLTVGASIFDTAASSAQAFSSKPVFYPSLAEYSKPKFGSKPALGNKVKFGPNCAYNRTLAIDSKPLFGSKPIFGSKPLLSSKSEFNRRPVFSSHLHYGNKQQIQFKRKLGLDSKPVYGGNVFCYKPSIDRVDFSCRPAIYSKPSLHNNKTGYSILRSRSVLNSNSNSTVHGSSRSSDSDPNSRIWAFPTSGSGQSTRSSIGHFSGRPARPLLRSPRLILQPRPAERIVRRLSVWWQWVVKKFKRQRLPAIAF